MQGTLDGLPVEILIDSGASVNFVDHNITRKLGLSVEKKPISIGMASSEVSIKTLGKVTGSLNLNTQIVHSM